MGAGPRAAPTSCCVRRRCACGERQPANTRSDVRVPQPVRWHTGQAQSTTIRAVHTPVEHVHALACFTHATGGTLPKGHVTLATKPNNWPPSAYLSLMLIQRATRCASKAGAGCSPALPPPVDQHEQTKGPWGSSAQHQHAIQSQLAAYTIANGHVGRPGASCCVFYKVSVIYQVSAGVQVVGWEDGCIGHTHVSAPCRCTDVAALAVTAPRAAPMGLCRTKPD